ncbi:hypothetical protein PAECIP111894_04547 [Paenibacillus pseudetheri]|uniref:Uncharacterized protein n=1 Tax=Paenibacillus pseudetheri TaxID=2897682 RepID=A0ABM9BHH4_9BACL|nr:hypothetical protein PAECIP111894_04547 [Paenibacillus pseudetheri]
MKYSNDQHIKKTQILVMGSVPIVQAEFFMLLIFIGQPFKIERMLTIKGVI